MTDDFMKWAGLDEARWQLLQDKLKHLVKTERTAARIMMALMNDDNIGYREQIVLTYWLGRQQAILTAPALSKPHKRVLVSGLS